jgi:C-terminal processing protease CtpA/Prc
MRGYPRGTAWSIGPWLNRKKARFATAFREPWLSGDALDGRVTYQFLQPFPPTTGPTYLGRVSMLFDERAISQSEHTALFFEQATDVLFVGSPSAGANGDVTALPLPGGLLLRFTGHDVRHLDGRQLQRVGIRPDIPVRPTAAGLRAGRDEVLERALRELRARTTVKARARAPAVDESHRPGKGP